MAARVQLILLYLTAICTGLFGEAVSAGKTSCYIPPVKAGKETLLMCLFDNVNMSDADTVTVNAYVGSGKGAHLAVLTLKNSVNGFGEPVMSPGAGFDFRNVSQTSADGMKWKVLIGLQNATAAYEGTYSCQVQSATSLDLDDQECQFLLDRIVATIQNTSLLRLFVDLQGVADSRKENYLIHRVQLRNQSTGRVLQNYTLSKPANKYTLSDLQNDNKYEVTVCLGKRQIPFLRSICIPKVSHLRIGGVKSNRLRVDWDPPPVTCQDIVASYKYQVCYKEVNDIEVHLNHQCSYSDKPYATVSSLTVGTKYKISVRVNFGSNEYGPFTTREAKVPAYVDRSSGIDMDILMSLMPLVVIVIGGFVIFAYKKYRRRAKPSDERQNLISDGPNDIEEPANIHGGSASDRKEIQDKCRALEEGWELLAAQLEEKDLAIKHLEEEQQGTVAKIESLEAEWEQQIKEFDASIKCLDLKKEETTEMLKKKNDKLGEMLAEKEIKITELQKERQEIQDKCRALEEGWEFLAAQLEEKDLAIKHLEEEKQENVVERERLKDKLKQRIEEFEASRKRLDEEKQITTQNWKTEKAKLKGTLAKKEDKIKQLKKEKKESEKQQKEQEIRIATLQLKDTMVKERSDLQRKAKEEELNRRGVQEIPKQVHEELETLREKLMKSRKREMMYSNHFQEPIFQMFQREPYFWQRFPSLEERVHYVTARMFQEEEQIQTMCKKLIKELEEKFRDRPQRDDLMSPTDRICFDLAGNAGEDRGNESCSTANRFINPGRSDPGATSGCSRDLQGQSHSSAARSLFTPQSNAVPASVSAPNTGYAGVKTEETKD